MTENVKFIGQVLIVAAVAMFMMIDNTAYGIEVFEEESMPAWEVEMYKNMPATSHN